MKFTMNQKILLGGVLGFLALTAIGVYEALHDGEAERRTQEDIDEMFKDLTREELDIKRESEETKEQLENLTDDMLTKAREIFLHHLKDIEKYNSTVDERHKIKIDKEDIEKYNSMVDEKHKIDFTKLN